MKVTLKFHSPTIAKEIVLSKDQSITVGRSGKCDIQIKDDRASSKHCRVSLRGDLLEVVDLDSKNGTYLNSIRVDQSQLFVGDKLLIGRTVMTFEESACDEEALGVLAFPGQVKERMAYTMKADFTGARPSLAAQKSNHDIEIEIRRKINSQMRLSKQEIKSIHSIAGAT